MVEVSVEQDRVIFEVQQMDKLWSLRSRLEIPIDHIKAAHIDTHPAMGFLQGIKIAGTDVPNIFKAGTFYQDGGLVFWDVRHAEHTIVVELIHERYHKLVIEVADSEAAVARINGAIARRRT